jgi:hypothetical protein
MTTSGPTPLPPSDPRLLITGPLLPGPDPTRTTPLLEDLFHEWTTKYFPGERWAHLSPTAKNLIQLSFMGGVAKLIQTLLEIQDETARWQAIVDLSLDIGREMIQPTPPPA